MPRAGRCHPAARTVQGCLKARFLALTQSLTLVSRVRRFNALGYAVSSTSSLPTEPAVNVHPDTA